MSGFVDDRIASGTDPFENSVAFDLRLFFVDGKRHFLSLVFIDLRHSNHVSQYQWMTEASEQVPVSRISVRPLVSSDWSKTHPPTTVYTTEIG